MNSVRCTKDQRGLGVRRVPSRRPRKPMERAAPEETLKWAHGRLARNCFSAASPGAVDDFVAFLEVCVKHPGLRHLALDVCYALLRRHERVMQQGTCIRLLTCFSRVPRSGQVSGTISALLRMAHPSYPRPAVRLAALQVLAEIDRGLCDTLFLLGPSEIWSAWSKCLSSVPTQSCADLCSVCHVGTTEPGAGITTGGDVFVCLPCSHTYHLRCIRLWSQTSERAPCPVCRSPILESIQQHLLENDLWK